MMHKPLNPAKAGKPTRDFDRAVNPPPPEKAQEEGKRRKGGFPMTPSRLRKQQLRTLARGGRI